MYIFYPIFLAWDCFLDRGPRILVVTSNTFYAPLIAKLFSGNRQLVVHLVWDLFPDVLLFEQRFATNGLISRLVTGVMRQTFDRVSASVFIGQRLLSHAKSRFGQIGKTYIIPVGCNPRVFKEYKPHIVEIHRPVEILYCGNLGTMHDTATLIEAIRYADDNNIGLNGIALTFHSFGSKYPKFREEVQGLGRTLAKKISLESTLNELDWILRMGQSHVALVTMKPGSEKIVMPSKTYSALAAGQAILAICPYESDLAEMVIEEDCGWVVTPGKRDELLNALKVIATDRNELHRKRENAFRIGQSKYSETNIAREWINLFNNFSI
jgi:glycosyltransferase involved in cell wall biosynthesis